MTAVPQPPPLFPQPIPIIGLTGEYASGKTLFGLTIDPAHTLVYDLEKSSESYLSLGFTRIDVPAELQRRYPAGYKPAQTFSWWCDHMRSVRPGQYRVLMIDPASEVESGITEWVRANPGYFGHTAGQYTKMQALMWGDVKELWKSLLADLASRCETFVFCVHMGDVWSGDKPVAGKRKPKGKSTLMELASLYLQMERKPDTKGNVPVKPAALVLKSRLAHLRMGADGEPVIVPALPPRLPVATPAAIRQFMLHPPDYSHLQPDQQAPEQQITEDDRAAVRLATAEAERDAEQLRLDRQQRQQEAEQQRLQRQHEAEQRKAAVAAAAVAAATPNGKRVEPAATAVLPPPPPPSPPAPLRQTASFSAHAITEEQLATLAELRTSLWAATMPTATDADKKAAWERILAKRKVNTARALTQQQADELIAKIRTQLDVQVLQQGLDQGQQGGTADADSGG